ncbi:hypothetical protein [Candidatus Phytoplasma solani]|uniref:Uncharacterized protein n=1 Tax=Candidatus Phytoplasma solani TaxID=69896 RepID=A0A421NU82_9MOLU|nr:hypothetical protein [Candidatus Phytoplasma solani]RMI87588.1 hypothetical protein PSSA1_v1c7060 [Candidatus Phytoplasma solani]
MTTQKLHPLQITAYISIILHFIFIVAINYHNNQIPFLPKTAKQPEQTQTQPTPNQLEKKQTKIKGE